MLKELKDMKGEFWDLDGFFTARNYSDKTEVVQFPGCIPAAD